MTTAIDPNGAIIEEFRANSGKLGGYFKGAPVLLLSTIGARSGQPRTNPVMYLPDRDRWVVFASKGGAPTNPDWFHNLRANPNVTVELGSETLKATAEIVEGPERDRLYARQAELYPGFGQYERMNARRIPVVALTRTR